MYYLTILILKFILKPFSILPAVTELKCNHFVLSGAIVQVQYKG